MWEIPKVHYPQISVQVNFENGNIWPWISVVPGGWLLSIWELSII